MLRAFRAGDLDGLAAMNADPEVQRFLYAGRVLTREDAWMQMTMAVGQWGLRGYGLFAVEAEGRFAGRIGVLHPLEWPEQELAYALDAPFRGQGLATEAVRSSPSWPGLNRPSTHPPSYSDPDCPSCRAWMAGSSPAMTGCFLLGGQRRSNPGQAAHERS